jgi:hypothetical protein
MQEPGGEPGADRESMARYPRLALLGDEGFLYIPENALMLVEPSTEAST